MLNPAIRVDSNIPNFEFCLSICATTEDATYATWNHLDHDCRQINPSELAIELALVRRFWFAILNLGWLF